MDIAKQLLLNLSALLSLLFFIQLHYDKKSTPLSTQTYRIYFFLSLLLCFILSSKLDTDFNFDLRQIPLTLSGLYLGFSNGIALFVFTMYVRIFYGIDEGFWTTFFVFGFQNIQTGLIHSWFIKQGLKKKLIISVWLSIFPSIIWSIIQYYNDQTINLEFLFSYVLIPVIGTMITVYTVDSINRNAMLHEQMVKAEKSELLSFFSSSILHEVRNPLTVIRGFLQLLQNTTLTTEKKLEYTQVALKELDRTESIITEYLSFSKPNQNTVQQVDVYKVLNNVITMITPLAEKNKVDIHVKLKEDVYIRGEISKLYQSLLNFIKNAMEAMLDGGKLHIENYCYNNKVYITIKDEGMGMSKEQINNLGKPYFSTKGDKGTGLGMMVSYQIIHTMQGKIDVKSQIGIGTVFTISFPM